MLLEGKVVKLGKESIHVIVLGFCSAAIMLEDIRQEFKYKIKGGYGTFVNLAHKRHAIKVGSMIRFLVKSMDEEILHLSGSLMNPSNTGCIRWLSKHGGDGASQINRSIKRPRGSDFVVGLQDQHSRLFDNVNQSQNLSRPHKSRKRIAE